ncbi:MAG: hypothetical protein NUV53_05375 [Patescibacteria group bacterium]|nr:hypothetical protein [Patescibacteria group bacterium]
MKKENIVTGVVVSVIIVAGGIFLFSKYAGPSAVIPGISGANQSTLAAVQVSLTPPSEDQNVPNESNPTPDDVAKIAEIVDVSTISLPDAGIPLEEESVQ